MDSFEFDSLANVAIDAYKRGREEEATLTSGKIADVERAAENKIAQLKGFLERIAAEPQPKPPARPPSEGRSREDFHAEWEAWAKSYQKSLDVSYAYIKKRAQLIDTNHPGDDDVPF